MLNERIGDLALFEETSPWLRLEGDHLESNFIGGLWLNWCGWSSKRRDAEAGSAHIQPRTKNCRPSVSQGTAFKGKQEIAVDPR
jgi:hypothetical protein